MLVPRTILQNRYRIVAKLGEGGMGAVYEAEHTELKDKKFAIKEILLDLEKGLNEEQLTLVRKAFRREADSLVKAEHEIVPDVVDFFEVEERLYLVMEHIAGDDLSETLKKRGDVFSIHEVSKWTTQLLQGLEYLHGLIPPIIHRDIKPQNLKISKHQKIKLLDFGIARSSEKSASLTQHTFIGASRDYSPIEQMLRVIDPTFREFILLRHRDKAEIFLNQDTDTRCDIFALGATLYHLLTNSVPVDATKRALGIWETGNDDLKEPSELNRHLPPGVSSWILKAMAFDRNDRFASAAEMNESLQHLLSVGDGSCDEKLKTDLEKSGASRFVDVNRSQETTVSILNPENSERTAVRRESGVVTEVMPNVLPKTEPAATLQVRTSRVPTGTEPHQRELIDSSEVVAVFERIRERSDLSASLRAESLAKRQRLRVASVVFLGLSLLAGAIYVSLPEVIEKPGNMAYPATTGGINTANTRESSNEDSANSSPIKSQSNDSSLSDPRRVKSENPRETQKLDSKSANTSSLSNSQRMTNIAIKGYVCKLSGFKMEKAKNCDECPRGYRCDPSYEDMDY